jgi:hypothetical protein
VFKILPVFFLVLLSPVSAPARKPVYARKATGFPTRCWRDQIKECRPLQIPSPDGLSVVRVSYHRENLDGANFILRASLQITEKDGSRVEIDAPGLVEAELLWSPDSSSFLINWSNSLQGDQGIAIYRLSRLKSDLTQTEYQSVIAAAQVDMIESFPPCRAKDADAQDCTSLANHPEYVDVAAVAWTRGSSAIIVMAEMPCSSRFGGVMCQVLGYELDSTSGKILRRMQPEEFARAWQPSMAWKFQDPGPPEYKAK